MIVGVPREIKPDEYRVAMLPVGAEELSQRRPHGLASRPAQGRGAESPTRRTQAAGATVVAEAAEIWSEAELVVKVKEPQPDGMAACCGPDRLFSRTFTSPPTRRSPGPSSTAASRRSPTRRCATRAAAFRC